MRSYVALALVIGSMVACSSSSAPPLVGSGGSPGQAGESSPDIPPCKSTVDAGDQTGAFLDASQDAPPQGTSNPTTPTIPDGSVLVGVDATVPVDSGTPCT